MKKWSVWLTCILVAALMIAGVAAIAAEYGSQSDPLVTLSYIEQVQKNGKEKLIHYLKIKIKMNILYFVHKKE